MNEHKAITSRPKGRNTFKTEYLETHFVVVESIVTNLYLRPDSGVIYGKVTNLMVTKGRGSLWALSEEITEAFETANEGREWDGDWEDEVWEFTENFILNNC